MSREMTDEQWDSLRYEIAQMVLLTICVSNHCQPNDFYAAKAVALANEIIKRFKELGND